MGCAFRIRDHHRDEGNEVGTTKDASGEPAAKEAKAEVSGGSDAKVLPAALVVDGEEPAAKKAKAEFVVRFPLRSRRGEIAREVEAEHSMEKFWLFLPTPDSVSSMDRATLLPPSPPSAHGPL